MYVVNAGVFLIMTGLVIAVYLTPLRDWLADGHFVKDRLGLFGFSAPLVFTFCTALLTVIGIPAYCYAHLEGSHLGSHGA